MADLQVCVCEDGFTIIGGELCITAGLQDLRDIISYTTAGIFSFTKATYPWLARVRVRVQGAGGGGGALSGTGASAIAASSGGAGGGYAESIVEAADLADTEQIVVGAGGQGGVVNDAGATGGDSWFGAHAVATGGGGGAQGPDTTAFGSGGRVALGGIGTVGDVLERGGDGEPGWGQGAVILRKAGSGGGSHFGGGRAGRATNGNGTAGRISSGEGGTGGANGPSQAAGLGGAGADGRVVVFLYG